MNQLLKPDKAAIVRLATQSFEKVCTPSNIASAFSSTGLFPPNPHAFDTFFAARAKVARPSHLSPSPAPAPSPSPLKAFTLLTSSRDRTGH